MIKHYLTVFLILTGIFIHPFQSGVVDFIFRFVLFSVIVYLLIFKKNSEHESDNRSRPSPGKIGIDPGTMAMSENIPDIFEYILKNDKIMFEYLIHQFQIIDGIVFSDNGYLLTYDSKSRITIYHQKTINQSEIDNYPLTGLLQLVDKKNDVLIENNLISDENLVNYLSVPDYNPGSFMGLPIAIREGKKLFFLFDAREKQHFNPEDRKIIKNIGNGVGTFIANRLNAVTLLEQVKENESLLLFSKSLIGCGTISAAIEVLAMQISKCFEASRLTICTVRSETGKGIIKKVIGQQDEFSENKEFTLDEGLTGWVISKQKPYLIEDLEKGEYFIPRYSKQEKSNYGLRSFLGIPIMNENVAYGAITLEHQLPKKYEKKDQIKIEKFIELFGSFYSRYQKQ